MRGLVVILFGLAAAGSANPTKSQRIVGGSVTTVEQYPEIAAILYVLEENTFGQGCGGTILNNRAILTADHCIDFINYMRIRLGSTYANSGGVVYHIAQAIFYPRLNDGLMHDIAILHVQGFIQFTNVIQPGKIAGPNYVVLDNHEVWAAGWGRTTDPATDPNSRGAEELHHVQLEKINHHICRERYATRRIEINTNLICSGLLDIGGRDQCRGDSGGPLFHNGVVIGVCSFGHPVSCGDPFLPGVNVRVANYTNWIYNNA